MTKRAFWIFVATLIAPHYAAQADAVCQAVYYRCNPNDGIMEVQSEFASCGSFDSPFTFIDTTNEGRYDPNKLWDAPVEKKCKLGKVEYTVQIGAGCTAYDGVVPGVVISRKKTATQDSSGGDEIFCAKLFGGACAPVADDVKIPSSVVIKQNKNNPNDFSIDEK